MEPATIKKLRLAMKLSQQAFSNYLGVTYTTVSSWEHGRFKPNQESLEKLKVLCVKHGI
jgi:DNA-binding transcriptional regulator YiaG